MICWHVLWTHLDVIECVCMSLEMCLYGLCMCFWRACMCLHVFVCVVTVFDGVFLCIGLGVCMCMSVDVLVSVLVPIHVIFILDRMAFIRLLKNGVVKFKQD